jgi:hypothetical protein
LVFVSSKIRIREPKFKIIIFARIPSFTFLSLLPDAHIELEKSTQANFTLGIKEYFPFGIQEAGR